MASRLPRSRPHASAHAGTIAIGGYTLRYTDLLTLCPQWKDIFVDRSLAFHADAAAPRILDCGANVGLASLFFKSCYPDARITAFEADPAIADVLAANLRANNCADVDVVPAAVWIDQSRLAFRLEGADSGGVCSTTVLPAGPTLDLRPSGCATI
jgi:hypothetical protein